LMDTYIIRDNNLFKVEDGYTSEINTNNENWSWKYWFFKRWKCKILDEQRVFIFRSPSEWINIHGNNSAVHSYSFDTPQT
jgi:hypothetical protein